MVDDDCRILADTSLTLSPTLPGRTTGASSLPGAPVLMAAPTSS